MGWSGRQIVVQVTGQPLCCSEQCELSVQADPVPACVLLTRETIKLLPLYVLLYGGAAVSVLAACERGALADVSWVEREVMMRRAGERGNSPGPERG